MLDKDSRVFVPLNTQPYREFERGSKTVELRGVNHQFNLDTVREDQTVELRRGYSTDDSLWGVITSVETFETVDELVAEAPIQEIQPGADETAFRETVSELLDGYDSYIAFEVELADES